MTGPDASGYYKVTLTAYAIPTNAIMISGGIGYTYGIGKITDAQNTQPLTQISGVTGYPWAPNFRYF